MTAALLGAALFAGYSRSEVVVSLLFAFVFAALGYRMSYRHRQARGVTPWRLPSGLWALICFFLQPFGIIVEILAQATTKSRYSAPASGAQTSGAQTSGISTTGNRAGTVAYAALRARQPALTGADSGGSGDVLAEQQGPAAPASDVDGKPAMFGWYPDVTCRHAERYWDGRGWTELVRDGGVSGSDPL